MKSRCPISIFGCIVFVIGLWLLARAYEFVAHSTKTIGKVVALKKEDADDETFFHPVVAFTDTSGIVHTQETSSGSSLSRFKAGDRVAIRYSTGTLRRVEIDNFESIWVFPLFFIGGGATFLVKHYRWVRKMEVEKTKAVADNPHRAA